MCDLEANEGSLLKGEMKQTRRLFTFTQWTTHSLYNQCMETFAHKVEFLFSYHKTNVFVAGIDFLWIIWTPNVIVTPDQSFST